jgi:hypothetical protein
MTILRVMAMFLAVLVAGSAYSEVHPNVKTADPKEAPKDEQRGSDNSPISIKIIPAPDAEAKAAKEERYRQEKASQDNWLTKSTVWLAFVTTILAGVTAGLWIATYRLGSDAKRTGDRQAIDTQASLSIAREAAKAAMENATATMASERAYVFVNVKLIDETQTRPVPTGFIANFCNHGKTPAVITNIRSQIDVVSDIPNVMPEITPNDTTSDRELPEGLVIASELIYRVTMRPPNSSVTSYAAEINGGQKFLICYGQIRYKDIFDKKRETGFCWQYSPTQRRFIYSDSQLNKYN